MSRRRFSRAGRALAAAAALVAAAAAGAAPASPTRDTVVETRLVAPAVKATLRSMGARVADDADPQPRLMRAQRLIEASRRSGDLRLLGYAQALLADWPVERANTPIDALVLQATIAQSRHEFDAARALLDRALARAPRHAQARLTRATVAQVQGDYDLARRDCLALTTRAADAAAVCVAAIDAATGADRAAIAPLLSVIDSGSPLRGWALATLGDLQLQRGETDAAARSYRAALREGDDPNTRALLADALLAGGDAAAAADAVRDAPATDGVLLRRWLAARRLRDAAEADRLQAELAQRFATARARGELLHSRETAWFELEAGRPGPALADARENWRVQREATDLWLLVRAARAAGDRATLDEAAAWVRRTGLNDVRVRRELEART
jgi:Tfp pilus assembly protein PilF